jgi:hypothetical protein
VFHDLPVLIEAEAVDRHVPFIAESLPVRAIPDRALLRDGAHEREFPVWMLPRKDSADCQAIRLDRFLHGGLQIMFRRLPSESSF